MFWIKIMLTREQGLQNIRYKSCTMQTYYIKHNQSKYNILDAEM